jgi:mannose-6-phosphate isomerase-like protein (cupin superfamily)
MAKSKEFTADNTSSPPFPIPAPIPAPLVVVARDDAAPFTTKDGSTIRELLAPRGPAAGVLRNQSLAEATLPPGASTDAHYHPITEELYYVLRGSGYMQIGEQARAVGPGDGIAIPPGAPHRITNTGTEDLVFLCCCAPAYTHEDTVMIDLPSPTPPPAPSSSL